MIEQLTEEYKTAHAQFLELLELFPVEKIEEQLFDGFTITQLMKRILLAEIFMVAVLDDFKEGREIPWEDPYDEEDAVNYSESNWDQLYEDLVFTGDKVIETLTLFPPKKWQEEIWEGKKLTPQKIVEIELDYLRDCYIPDILQYIEDLEDTV